MLENVNLKKKLSREEYKRALPGLQRRLYDLEKACWDNRVSSIVVFEGWDAAGKGTTIATLTQRLDPRGFKLYSITAPRTYEQQRPWLWRFWLKVPNRGEMVLFDQSWYTRVLSDRVERVVGEKIWRAAYQDIVEFERMLADDGTVLIKIFLHISRKEQKKRFEEIEADPLESWRVKEEDWARHNKYDEYREAIEAMLERTESEYAPWTIVEGTSRWYARQKVFETIIGRLEERLGDKAPARTEKDGGAARDEELREETERLERPRRKKR